MNHLEAQVDFAFHLKNKNNLIEINREIQDEDYKHSKNLKEDYSQNRTKLPKTTEA